MAEPHYCLLCERSHGRFCPTEARFGESEEWAEQEYDVDLDRKRRMEDQLVCKGE